MVFDNACMADHWIWPVSFPSHSYKKKDGEYKIKSLFFVRCWQWMTNLLAMPSQLLQCAVLHSTVQYYGSDPQAFTNMANSKTPNVTAEQSVFASVFFSPCCNDEKVSKEFLSLPKTSLCYCHIVNQCVVFTVFLLCFDIDTYCELVVRCMLVCTQIPDNLKVHKNENFLV